MAEKKRRRNISYFELVIFEIKKTFGLDSIQIMCDHVGQCKKCGYLAFFYEKISDAFDIDEDKLRKEYFKCDKFEDCDTCGKEETPLWFCILCKGYNCKNCKITRTCGKCGLISCSSCVIKCEHCEYSLCSHCVDMADIAPEHIF